jgi:hypothetical protein
MLNTLRFSLNTQIFMCLLCRISGYMMMDKLEVPRRKVRKNWYVGLNPDPVDRSHPDVHDSSIGKGSASKESIHEGKSGIEESSNGTQSRMLYYILYRVVKFPIETNTPFSFCLSLQSLSFYSCRSMGWNLCGAIKLKTRKYFKKRNNWEHPF